MKSVREYKQALSINDNIADVHLLLGLLYRAMASDPNSTDLNPAKYYPDAVDSFSRAYALNPSDPIPNLYISRILATNGEFAKAIQYAEQVVRDAPANPLYRGNLGVMLYRNLQYPEAIDQLTLLVNGGKSEDGQDIAPCSWCRLNPASPNTTSPTGWRSSGKTAAAMQFPSFNSF